MIAGGLAHIDCRVIHTFPLKSSTLMIGEVVAAQSAEETNHWCISTELFKGLAE
jgi:flavin reductase (DIM6/NTAB) family NADH-FMN oxidoreductase RutF